MDQKQQKMMQMQQQQMQQQQMQQQQMQQQQMQQQMLQQQQQQQRMLQMHQMQQLQQQSMPTSFAPALPMTGPAAQEYDVVTVTPAGIQVTPLPAAPIPPAPPMVGGMPYMPTQGMTGMYPQQ